jgi:hypothetical protein
VAGRSHPRRHPNLARTRQGVTPRMSA